MAILPAQDARSLSLRANRRTLCDVDIASGAECGHQTLDKAKGRQSIEVSGRRGPSSWGKGQHVLQGSRTNLCSSPWNLLLSAPRVWAEARYGSSFSALLVRLGLRWRRGPCLEWCACGRRNLCLRRGGLRGDRGANLVEGLANDADDVVKGVSTDLYADAPERDSCALRLGVGWSFGGGGRWR